MIRFLFVHDPFIALHELWLMDDNQEEVEKHFNYLMFSFPVYTSGLQTNRMDTFYTLSSRTMSSLTLRWPCASSRGKSEGWVAKHKHKVLSDSRNFFIILWSTGESTVSTLQELGTCVFSFQAMFEGRYSTSQEEPRGEMRQTFE